RPAGREDGGDVSDSDRMNDDLEYYGDELDENEDEFSIEDDEEMDSRAAMMHDALLNEIISKNTCRGRVDWFMLFDLALWKEVRSGLRELYMATMMLDPDYKIRIAIAFARNYPNICRSFLDKDRSPEHS
ncbi:E3 ubiquitin-protein ligase ubr1, partial [Spiromyces aspiralis]